MHRKLVKKKKELPYNIQYKFNLLLRELNTEGPYRTNWLNYGRLKNMNDTYHCHIKKGNPTYVVVWEIKDKKIKIMEVTYVGTHEKAPY